MGIKMEMAGLEHNGRIFFSFSFFSSFFSMRDNCSISL